MPSKVLSPRPSARAWAKAVSRFGPVVPLASARASVWQAEHCSLNLALPLTRLVPLFFTQPVSATVAARLPITIRPLLIGGILPWLHADGVPSRQRGVVRDDGRRQPRYAA